MAFISWCFLFAPLLAAPPEQLPVPPDCVLLLQITSKHSAERRQRGGVRRRQAFHSEENEYDPGWNIGLDESETDGGEMSWYAGAAPDSSSIPDRSESDVPQGRHIGPVGQIVSSTDVRAEADLPSGRWNKLAAQLTSSTGPAMPDRRPNGWRKLSQRGSQMGHPAVTVSASSAVPLARSHEFETAWSKPADTPSSRANSALKADESQNLWSNRAKESTPSGEAFVEAGKPRGASLKPVRQPPPSKESLATDTRDKSQGRWTQFVAKLASAPSNSDLSKILVELKKDRELDKSNGSFQELLPNSGGWTDLISHLEGKLGDYMVQQGGAAQGTADIPASDVTNAARQYLEVSGGGDAPITQETQHGSPASSTSPAQPMSEVAAAPGTADVPATDYSQKAVEAASQYVAKYSGFGVPTPPDRLQDSPAADTHIASVNEGSRDGYDTGGTGGAGDYLSKNGGAAAPDTASAPPADPAKLDTSEADWANTINGTGSVADYEAMYTAAAAASATPMPDWSKGEWTKYVGGTGSAGDYMSGNAAPNTTGALPQDVGTGSVADYMAKDGSPSTPVSDVGTRSVADHVSVYGASDGSGTTSHKDSSLSPSSPAVAAKLAPPDWNQGEWTKYAGGTGSAADYMAKYSGSTPSTPGAPVPDASQGAWTQFLGGTGSVNDYMARYGGAPPPSSLGAPGTLPDAPAPVGASAAAVPDWSQGEWTKYTGGTGSAADYMSKYSGGPQSTPDAPAPDASQGAWTQFLGGTGSIADYMGRYNRPPSNVPAPGYVKPSSATAGPDVGTGSVADYMARFSGAPSNIPAASYVELSKAPATLDVGTGSVADYMASYSGSAPNVPAPGYANPWSAKARADMSQAASSLAAASSMDDQQPGRPAHGSSQRGQTQPTVPGANDNVVFPIDLPQNSIAGITNASRGEWSEFIGGTAGVSDPAAADSPATAMRKSAAARAPPLSPANVAVPSAHELTGATASDYMKSFDTGSAARHMVKSSDSPQSTRSVPVPRAPGPISDNPLPPGASASDYMKLFDTGSAPIPVGAAAPLAPVRLSDNPLPPGASASDYMKLFNVRSAADYMTQFSGTPPSAASAPAPRAPEPMSNNPLPPGASASDYMKLFGGDSAPDYMAHQSGPPMSLASAPAPHAPDRVSDNPLPPGASASDYMKLFNTGSAADYMARSIGVASNPPSSPVPEASQGNGQASSVEPTSLVAGATTKETFAVPASATGPGINDWSKGEWTKYTAGTGSAADYMAAYSGAPLPTGSQAAPPPAMPDWSSGDWSKYTGGTGSAADYMAQYSGAGPNPASASSQAAPAPAPPMPDWSQGEWSQYIGGTGSASDYMTRYSSGAAPSAPDASTQANTAAAPDMLPGTQLTAETGDHMPYYMVQSAAAASPAMLQGPSSPAPDGSASAAGAVSSRPDWSQGEWTKLLGGTGSAGDYMARYSGAPANPASAPVPGAADPNPIKSDNPLPAGASASDYMKLFNTGSAADYMAKYSGSPPSQGAPPVPSDPKSDNPLPPGASASDYMKLFNTGSAADYMGRFSGAPQNSRSPSAPSAAVPNLPPGASAGDYMVLYSGTAPRPASPAFPGEAGAPVSLVAGPVAQDAVQAAPVPLAAAPGMPDWSQGEWTKYTDGTGSAADYMTQYSASPPSTPEAPAVDAAVPQGTWTQFIGGTGSAADYMSKYGGGQAAGAAAPAAPAPAMPDWSKGEWTKFTGGTGSAADYMAGGGVPNAAMLAGGSATSVIQQVPATPAGAPDWFALAQGSGSVGDYMSKYSTAPGATAIAPAPIAPVPGVDGPGVVASTTLMRDFGKGSWTKFFDGTAPAVTAAPNPIQQLNPSVAAPAPAAQPDWGEHAQQYLYGDWTEHADVNANGGQIVQTTTTAMPAGLFHEAPEELKAEEAMYSGGPENVAQNVLGAAVITAPAVAAADMDSISTQDFVATRGDFVATLPIQTAPSSPVLPYDSRSNVRECAPGDC